MSEVGFLPAEVARLVYGYLDSCDCSGAKSAFLDECSPDLRLREIASLVEQGLLRTFDVDGLSLLDILNEYAAIKSQLDALLSDALKLTQLYKSDGPLRKLKLLSEHWVNKANVAKPIAAEAVDPSADGCSNCSKSNSNKYKMKLATLIRPNQSSRTKNMMLERKKREQESMATAQQVQRMLFNPEKRSSSSCVRSEQVFKTPSSPVKSPKKTNLDMPTSPFKKADVVVVSPLKSRKSALKARVPMKNKQHQQEMIDAESSAVRKKIGALTQNNNEDLMNRVIGEPIANLINAASADKDEDKMVDNFLANDELINKFLQVLDEVEAADITTSNKNVTTNKPPVDTGPLSNSSSTFHLSIDDVSPSQTHHHNTNTMWTNDLEFHDDSQSYDHEVDEMVIKETIPKDDDKVVVPETKPPDDEVAKSSPEKGPSSDEAPRATTPLALLQIQTPVPKDLLESAKSFTEPVPESAQEEEKTVESNSCNNDFDATSIQDEDNVIEVSQEEVSSVVCLEVVSQLPPDAVPLTEPQQEEGEEEQQPQPRRSKRKRTLKVVKYDPSHKPKKRNIRPKKEDVPADDTKEKRHFALMRASFNSLCKSDKRALQLLNHVPGSCDHSVVGLVRHLMEVNLITSASLDEAETDLEVSAIDLNQDIIDQLFDASLCQATEENASDTVTLNLEGQSVQLTNAEVNQLSEILDGLKPQLPEVASASTTELLAKPSPLKKPPEELLAKPSPLKKVVEQEAAGVAAKSPRMAEMMMMATPMPSPFASSPGTPAKDTTLASVSFTPDLIQTHVPSVTEHFHGMVGMETPSPQQQQPSLSIETPSPHHPQDDTLTTPPSEHFDKAKASSPILASGCNSIGAPKTPKNTRPEEEKMTTPLKALSDAAKRLFAAEGDKTFVFLSPSKRRPRRVPLVAVTTHSPLKDAFNSHWESLHDVNNLDHYQSKVKAQSKHEHHHLEESSCASLEAALDAMVACQNKDKQPTCFNQDSILMTPPRVEHLTPCKQRPTTPKTPKQNSKSSEEEHTMNTPLKTLSEAAKCLFAAAEGENRSFVFLSPSKREPRRMSLLPAVSPSYQSSDNAWESRHDVNNLDYYQSKIKEQEQQSNNNKRRRTSGTSSCAIMSKRHKPSTPSKLLQTPVKNNPVEESAVDFFMIDDSIDHPLAGPSSKPKTPCKNISYSPNMVASPRNLKTTPLKLFPTSRTRHPTTPGKSLDINMGLVPQLRTTPRKKTPSKQINQSITTSADNALHCALGLIPNTPPEVGVPSRTPPNTPDNSQRKKKSILKKQQQVQAIQRSLFVNAETGSSPAKKTPRKCYDSASPAKKTPRKNYSSPAKTPKKLYSSPAKTPRKHGEVSVNVSEALPAKSAALLTMTETYTLFQQEPWEHH